MAILLSQIVTSSLDRKQSHQIVHNSTTPQVNMSVTGDKTDNNVSSSTLNATPKSGFKYKIGKVRQTASVSVDSNTGLSFIQLNKRPNKKLYGVTKFDGCYSSDALLGKGTFGEVFKGVHIETQRAVAIKKMLVKTTEDVFPITAQREIIILKKLEHKNIVKLIEVIYDETTAHNNNSLSGTTSSGANTIATNTNGSVISSDGSKIPSKAFFMVLPYMVSDLAGILHNPHIELKMSQVKNMLLQIIEGIDYLHKMKYMHRDIKSANILIDHKGVLKLADFGLARNYYGPPPNIKFPGGAGVKAKYTSVVVTRWYRAPELVLGDKFYTTAVDMWGIGCVFAEFFIKSPVLQGKTDIDQGHVIFKLVGSPSKDSWPTFEYLVGHSAFEHTKYPPQLHEIFGKYLDDDGLDLLSKLLCLDPYQRITSVAAKQHSFFQKEPLPVPSLELPAEESHESDIEKFKKMRKDIEIQQNKLKLTDENLIETRAPLSKSVNSYVPSNKGANVVLPAGPKRKLEDAPSRFTNQTTKTAQPTPLARSRFEVNQKTHAGQNYSNSRISIGQQQQQQPIQQQQQQQQQQPQQSTSRFSNRTASQYAPKPFFESSSYVGSNSVAPREQHKNDDNLRGTIRLSASTSTKNPSNENPPGFQSYFEKYNSFGQFQNSHYQPEESNHSGFSNKRTQANDDEIDYGDEPHLRRKGKQQKQ